MKLFVNLAIGCTLIVVLLPVAISLVVANNAIRRINGPVR